MLESEDMHLGLNGDGSGANKLHANTEKLRRQGFAFNESAEPQIICRGILLKKNKWY